MKRYECPRCGAGVRPTDIQCGRCGTLLREAEDSEAKDSTAMEKAPDVILENILSREEMPVRPVGPESATGTRLRSLLERKGEELRRLEEELDARERQLLETVEQIERDSLEMEERLERLEREETTLSEKEETMRLREVELESSLETLKSSLSRYREGMVKPEQGEIDELLAMHQSLRRVSGVESVIPSADRTAEVSDVTKVDKEQAEFEAIKRAIYEEIDAQIGTGLDEGMGGVIPTGIEKLDQILVGGIPRAHVVLVNGTTGAMKSSLVYYIMHQAAVGRGFRGLYFSLEQSKESLIRQMEKLGMPREQSEEGLIVVDLSDLRNEMKYGTGDWRALLMRYVEDLRTTRELDLFALDSLESFKALSEFAFTREDLADLFDWFRSMGLTTLLISELPTDELVDSSQGELYLADGALELRMREIDDHRLQRLIRCPKMRGVNVDSRYYSFMFERGGFHLHFPMARPSD
jgi:KaiC/GvpD/RAD55 family RecA-like ATPase